MIVSRQTADVQQLLLVARILLLTCNGLTKCAVALFVRQIVTRENRKAWFTSTIVCTVMFAWTVASPLMLSVPLTPQQAIEPVAEAHLSDDVSVSYAIFIAR